ncbi:type III intermediate filament [Ictalurus punctatus]|uniref:Type III intermediate filament n=1 Tax=Ictalurus punctatus TaxID=7998 RepID=A0A979EZ21_ICTPU|nr:type III intermediate filament [Ictalurus punctatus]
MAMLRVSSYRKLFEEQHQRSATWLSQRCGTQILPSSARGGVSMIASPEPDFAAARALNREGLMRFSQERSIIATLNDRLAVLIDMVRCLEEENESLEAQIIELEERSAAKPIPSSSVSLDCPSDFSLEAIIERLRREKDEILCQKEELTKELHHIKIKYDEVVEQRTHLQLERRDVAVEVDTVTADCLALREQAAIFEEQLAAMEQQHELRIESLCEPTAEDRDDPTVSLQFPTIDLTPAITVIKDYYCQLAESLKFESGAVAIARGEEKGRNLEKHTGGKVKDYSEVMDVKGLKELIVKLQKELAELEACGEELGTEIEAKKQAHLLEIEELENCICRLEKEEADLQAQMKEQMGDYEELLNEKMALDIEIEAYRALVAVEEQRLCYP